MLLRQDFFLKLHEEVILFLTRQNSSHFPQTFRFIDVNIELLYFPLKELNFFSILVHFLICFVSSLNIHLQALIVLVLYLFLKFQLLFFDIKKESFPSPYYMYQFDFLTIFYHQYCHYPVSLFEIVLVDRKRVVWS